MTEIDSVKGTEHPTPPSTGALCGDVDRRTLYILGFGTVSAIIANVISPFQFASLYASG